MKVWKCVFALACVACAVTNPAPAAYPEKTIKIVVPYPAGGGSDAVARIVSKKLSDTWGKPVIIDNRPGADTQIGNQAVATAAPDGYTLLLVAPTFTLHKNMVASLPYDPGKDFTPIAPLAVYPYFLVVGNDVPAKTAGELVAYARKNPGKLFYAISSGGQFILAELMKHGSSIDVVGVRYKGGAPAVQAVMSGEVTYHIDQSGTLKSMIDSGKMRLLAVTGDRRSSLAPDAPTFSEVGLSGGEIVSWLGLAGPKGMSPQLVESINAAVRAALDSPDVKQQLTSLAAVPMAMSVKDFDDFMRKEAERYEKVIKQYDLKY